MRKRYFFCIIVLFLSFTSVVAVGQCHHEDTTIIGEVRTAYPCGMAISGSDKIAISSYHYDTARHKFPVKIWNTVARFMKGLKANDSIILTTPEAVAYDNAGNLYVVQTQRQDSNIMIYSPSLTLLKAIDNSSSPQWFNPRGISVYASHNIYVISGDSISSVAPYDTIPNTGKLIKITAPLGGATKSLLISGLRDPKAVVVNGPDIFVSEYSGNMVSRYSGTILTKADSVVINKPMDISVKDCKIYVTEEQNSTVRVMNALNFSDTTLSGDIQRPHSGAGKFGVGVNENYNLFLNRNDSNKVSFFKGVYEPAASGGGSVGGGGPWIDGRVFCRGTFAQLPYDTTGHWSSADTSVVTVDSSGHIYGVREGVVYIYHTIDTSVTPYFAEVDVPYNILNDLYTEGDTTLIYNSCNVCVGSAVNMYYDSLPNHGGYQSWSTNDPSLISIESYSTVAWTLQPGDASVIRTIINACGTYTSTYGLHIENSIDPGTILTSLTPPNEICGHRAQIFTDSGSTIAGVWSTSDTSLAVINQSGAITSKDSGYVALIYTVSNSCGDFATSYDLHITDYSIADTLKGADTLCTGSDSLYVSTGTPGGRWSSSDTTVLTIDTGGHAMAISAGTAVISYFTGICDRDTATHSVRVLAPLSAGSIIGSDSVCVNITITLSDTSGAPGGKWTSSDTSIAKVDAVTGTVRGVRRGSATISYTVKNRCDSFVATHLVTVNPFANAGSIVGLSNVCSGNSITLSDTAATPVGIWSSNNTLVAPISGSGVVTANSLHRDSAIISYINITTCGADTALLFLTINPSPDSGSITGASSVCSNDSITLINSTANPVGTWSSSNPTAAFISANGVVTGLTSAQVSATITYSVMTSACGSTFATKALTVNPLPNAGTITGPDSVCSGATISLSSSGSSGGAWSSGNPASASVSAGVVRGNSASPVTATITYAVSTTSCGSANATHNVTVKPLPNPGTISGPSHICSGASIQLSTNGTSGGTWSSDNTSSAVVGSTGMVTGVAPFFVDYVTFTYTVHSFGCGDSSATLGFDSYPVPVAGTVTGPAVGCTGSTGLYLVSGDNSIQFFGGSPYTVHWVSSDPTSIAIADSAGGGGAHFLLPGNTIVSYVLTTVCGNAHVDFPVEVDASPVPGTISGPSTVCAGSWISLSDPTGTPGGTWLGGSPGIATVSPAGVISASAPGLAYPFYFTVNYQANTPHCGHAYAAKFITVNPLPNAGTITGPSAACPWSSTTLTVSGSVGSGSWTSSNPYVATVTPSGILNGVGGGSTYVSYTATTACGSATTDLLVTIYPLLTAGTITGPSTICSGSGPAIYSSTAYPGMGTWTSSDPSVADVDIFSGLVTPHASGSTVVFYNVTNPCFGMNESFNINVDASPLAGTISGADTICSGATATLTNSTGTPGGTWSTSDPAAVTISAGGVITGLATTLTTVTITYTANTPNCGSAATIHQVVVAPAPAGGVVTGPDSVCSGASISLVFSGTPGGLWGVINAAVATASPVGVIAGLSVTADTTTVTYTLATFCGTISAHHTVAVNPLPYAGAISGADSVCSGAIISLSTTGLPGGTWSSGNTAIETVSAGGVVTGVSSTLTGTNIIYTSSTFSCGSASATHAVSVKPSPNAGVIGGSGNVCSGSTLSLTETAPDGSWASANSSIASVSPVGVVSGVSTTLANTTLSYTVATFSCGSATATWPITVNPLPIAGAITGPDSVCHGASITLVNATGDPGTWSSANTAIASVSPAGVVTGTSVFLATTNIIYTVATVCGTVTTTHPVTVKPSPNAGTISGFGSVCSGSTISLTETVPGGTWASANSSVASVSPTGVVSGVSTILANTTLSYTVVTFSCGSATATWPITVNPLPIAGAITGPDSVCHGASITLANATGDPGTWSSANTGIASVSPAGVVTGASVTLATTNIIYTVATVCGTVTTAHAVTVKPLPDAGAISGAGSVCSSSVISLTETVTGGTWASGNSSIASVSPSGVVMGMSITLANTTLSYTVSTFSCGSATATWPITVNPLPIAGAITGADSVCHGASMTLDNATGDPGIWSSANTGIASVSSTAVVTGTSATLATTNIVYTVTSACGIATTIHPVTVKPLPFAGNISGTDTFCSGTSITLSDPAPGGIWSSAATGVATVSPVGIVTGVASAFANTTISYSVSTFSCGTAVATFPIAVRPPVTAGTIVGPDSVCSGGGIAVTNTTGTTAGVWGSLNPSVATVNTAGVVSGIATTLDTVTITYTVTAGCGTAVTGYRVWIIPAPVAGAITGADSVCNGALITLANTTGGGTWSSGNISIATVSATGTVTGVAPVFSAVNILYTVTTACGSAFTTHLVNVLPQPNAGNINGLATVCVDSVITLTETVPGGAWTASNGNAVVSAGIVAGITTGSDIISYSVANACNTAIASTTITIITCAPAGIMTPRITETRIYPNPATSELIVQTDHDAYTRFSITGCNGAKLIEQAIEKTETIIDIAKLAPGIYYIRLIGTSGAEVLKFTKL